MNEKGFAIVQVGVELFSMHGSHLYNVFIFINTKIGSLNEANNRVIVGCHGNWV